MSRQIVITSCSREDLAPADITKMTRDDEKLEKAIRSYAKSRQLQECEFVKNCALTPLQAMFAFYSDELEKVEDAKP